LQIVSFCDVHPNPIEEDVIRGAQMYKKEGCQGFIALGGGSPMDAAKGMMILIDHPEPLAQYDDTKGGDRLITKPLPPLFAIATTAGTGSEVGRSSVIIIKATGDKTILFHPTMMPKIAVLEPELTKDLPKSVTVATGLDAFTHNLEAYLAPGFHPMADGIALQGMELILDNLPLVYKNGGDLEARGRMLMAATMGATAFQKGLGMIHSMAHPLSSECGLHHGLANALCLPTCIEFLEKADLKQEQRQRLEKVQELFQNRGLARATLAESCRVFFTGLGIQFGLVNHGVKKDQLEILSHKAFLDPCHGCNMIPVREVDFKNVFAHAFGASAR
jgi:alcohol dehydrogenase class IV